MTKTRALQVMTPDDLEIVMTRLFDAPRHAVFDALCTPAYLEQWLAGPPGWSMVECDVDARPNGAFRHVWNGPHGEHVVRSGIYREFMPPDLLVCVESIDTGTHGPAGVATGTFVLSEEEDERTLVTLTLIYPSRAARDAVIAAGMERGISVATDRLEKLLRAPEALAHGVA